MFLNNKSYYIVRLFLDLLVLIISFYVAYFIEIEIKHIEFTYNDQFLIFILLVGWILLSDFFNLYDEFRSRNFGAELILTLKTFFYQPIISMIILFIYKGNQLHNFFVFNYSVVFAVILITEKFLLRLFLRKIRKKGKNTRNILIIGAGEVGLEFWKTIEENLQFGYKLGGFIDDNEKTKKRLNDKYLGKISDLSTILETININDVIITLPNYAANKVKEIIRICENYTKRVKIIPDYYQFVSDKYEFSRFGKFPIISVRNEKINDFNSRLLKRAFDTTVTVLLFLIIFWWLFILIAIAIKIESKGNVFFNKERWGRENKKFIIYKFRSMGNDVPTTDKHGKHLGTKKNDPRITKVGKYLRKFNLDELPQFINVLKGEMSIVGPRPHSTPLNIQSKDEVNNYMVRHLVKPGITGWAQVCGLRGDASKIDHMQKRIDHDIWYIENWSFGLDLQIIYSTIINTFKGDSNAY